MTGGGRGRFLELDVLRGVAALLVVLYHYTSVYGSRLGHAPGLWFEVPCGRYGVQLFFLISGFVILMTLERTRRPLDFVVSRASRLFPAYWLAGLLTFSVVRLYDLPTFGVGVGDALLNVPMIAGFVGVPYVDDVYWTLTVELIFYVLVAAIAFSGLRRRFVAVCGGWLLLSGAATLAFRFGLEFPRALHRVLILNHAYLFVAGMMFHRIRVHGFAFAPGLLIAASLGLSLVLVDAPCNAVVAAWFVLLAAAVAGRLEWIAVRPLLFLGTISYTLYLLHQNVGYVVIDAAYRRGLGPNAAVATALSTSIALAAAVSFLVERPAQRAIRAWYAGVDARPRGAVGETLS